MKEAISGQRSATPKRKQPKEWRLAGFNSLTFRFGDVCRAHSKSEARAIFKRVLGIPGVGRLPAGVQVELVRDPNRERAAA